MADCNCVPLTKCERMALKEILSNASYNLRTNSSSRAGGQISAALSLVEAKLKCCEEACNGRCR